MIRFSPSYLSVIILMVFTYLTSEWVKSPPIVENNALPLQRLPKQIGKWQAMQESEIGGRTAKVLGLNQSLIRQYVDPDDRIVELVIIQYNDQKFEAQIHSPQHCLPGAGWEIIRHEQFALPGCGNEVAFASKISIKKDKANQDILYWFVSDHKIVQNEYGLKLQILKNRLLRKPTPIYFIRVIANGDNESNGVADQSLKEFLLDAFGMLTLLTGL